MHSDMPFCEFLEEWLKIVKGSVRSATLASYASMVKSPIRPYFEKKGNTLGPQAGAHSEVLHGSVGAGLSQQRHPLSCRDSQSAEIRREGGAAER